ncbi:hypothetical protein SRHO_G00183690 [Serrasalmus rhombeus]
MCPWTVIKRKSCACGGSNISDGTCYWLLDHTNTHLLTNKRDNSRRACKPSSQKASSYEETQSMNRFRAGNPGPPASDQVKEDTVSKSNIKESQPPSPSEPVLSTCSSASDQVREDTVSKSNIKESQPPSPSEPVLSTCSSASDQVREDTVSKSNIKESQPPSPSEPVLSTCSSASDQRTGKNTKSENSAQENYQLLQSGPVLFACSLASDQRSKKDTISESSAQENCLPLQSRPALSACSSASDKMRNSNPEKIAWVTPMSRQSEPLKDHSNNSSSGQVKHVHRKEEKLGK